jgi:hypothetical protein
MAEPRTRMLKTKAPPARKVVKATRRQEKPPTKPANDAGARGILT